jgi:hypothetical protein
MVDPQAALLKRNIALTALVYQRLSTKQSPPPLLLDSISGIME